MKRKNFNRRKKSNNSLYFIVILIFIAAILYNCISTQKVEQEDSIQTTQSFSRNVVSQNNLTHSLQNLEIPICPGTHNETDHQIRNFNHYSICYREQYEQAEWSAYSLEKSQLENRVNRTDDFREDPLITTGSASLQDYRRSGYDRGHLTPAADREFSVEAVSETFYMSNMSPQFPAFNRGIWQHLEHQVRVWANNFGKVYVVSGPILEKPSSEYASIGANKVSIPQYYYKVILTQTPQGFMAIGFIISNAKHTDEFWNYAVTIDEVEKRTGLDFFSALEDSIEEKVESNFDLSKWKF